MGNDANHPLLNAMIEVSNVLAVSVSNSDDISGKIKEFTSKVTHQAMHDVELDIRGLKVGDMTPEKITSLYRGEQLVVFGHYWGSGDANVELKAKVSGESKSYKTRFAFPDHNSSNETSNKLCLQKMRITLLIEVGCARRVNYLTAISMRMFL